MNCIPLLLLSALLLGPHAPAQTRPDPGFRAWLWATADQPRDEALRKVLGELGFHGLATEPTEDFARLAELGIPFYVDQLVGNDVLALSPKTWAAARKAAIGSDHPVLARPRCLHDPAVMEAARADLRQRLAALAKHRPAFVSLRDEPSFTSRLNPVDWCDSRHARAAFSGFLEARWGGADRIAPAWGVTTDTPFIPQRTQTARDRYYHGRAGNRSLVPWNDTRAFADLTFTEAVRDLTRATQGALPGVPVGILGGQMPHAFGGFDWERLCRPLRIIEVYDHGGVRDIVRSLASPGTRFLSTVVTADARPRAGVANSAWHRVLQGDHELVIYESGDVFSESDPSEPTPWMKAIQPHLKAMAGPSLAGWRRGRPLDPQIAIMVSMPSIRLHWLNDSRRDGLSWVNRLTSHELAHSTQARTRESWVALLEDLGLRFRFVTPEQVADGILHKIDFKALVLPRTIAISAREVENITKFVAGGKLLIADCQTGLYTGHLARRERAALDSLLGIRRRGHDVHLDGERVLPRGRDAGLPYPIAEPRLFGAGAHARHRADDVAAVLVGTPSSGQQGRTLYLNLLILDYVRHRLTDPKRAAWLRTQVGGILQHAGVRPIARITRASDAAQWPIAVRARHDGEDVVLALHVSVVTGSFPVPWDRIVKSGAVDVSLRFGGTWTVTDEVSGEKLGIANQLDIAIAIDRPRMLRLSR